jgi:hypothetical protein
MGVAPDRRNDAASGQVRLLGVSVFKVQKSRINLREGLYNYLFLRHLQGEA